MTMSRKIQTPGATPPDQEPAAVTEPTPTPTPAPAPTPTPPAKPAKKDAGADKLTAEQQEIADLKAQNAEMQKAVKGLQAQVNRKPAAAHAPTSKPAVVSAKSVDSSKITRAVLTDEGYICPAPPLEPKK